MELNGNVVTRVCGIWHVDFETKPRNESNVELKSYVDGESLFTRCKQINDENPNLGYCLFDDT